MPRRPIDIETLRRQFDRRAPKREASRTSRRLALRLALSAAAVLSVSQAAGLLPMGDADARQWLRAQGLVHVLEGRDVVVWGDVLGCIRDAVVTPTAPPPPKVALGRVRLRLI